MEETFPGALALSPSAGDLSAGGLTTVEARLGAAFLVRYRGHTRETYQRALRHWSQWCIDHDLALLEVRREHVERWLRELEESGVAASTRAVHLAAVSGYYELAVDEELMRRNPVAAVRRPKLPKDSQRLGIDKDDGTRLLAVAEVTVSVSRRDYLLACLLLLNGLRVSEALALNLGDIRVERGHTVASVRRKGDTRQDVVLPPRTVAALDLACGDRQTGPLLITSSGHRVDRWAAQKITRRLARQAGVPHRVFPHALRHGFITAGLDAGVPLHRVQDAAGHADPRTTRRYDRKRQALDNHAAYAVASYFT